MNTHKLKCLFGFHEYTVPRKCGIDEYNIGILMCCHCHRSGRRLYIDGSDRTWWFDYNEDGNLIHRWNSDGYEEWFEYNIKGHKIHQIDNHNHETWEDRDEEGNLRYRKNSYGHRWWFNEKGECIQHENTLVQ